MYKDSNLLDKWTKLLKISICALKVAQTLLPASSDLMKENIKNIVSFTDEIKGKKDISDAIVKVLISLQFEDRCTQQMECSEEIILTIISIMEEIIVEMSNLFKSDGFLTSEDLDLVDDIKSHLKISEFKYLFEKELNLANLIKFSEISVKKDSDDVELF